ncbi:hypothetical protein ACR9PT_07510 [Piscirickettsia salmonis]|uniref:hypothetical protein n=1 Tax=Piscirickettsia salmonis TaxID=1238 RepID=UPI003EBA5199
MSIVRIHRKEKDFVVLDKQFLNDEGLSFRAKGMLSYLLSLPDDWKVSRSHLAKISQDGPTSVNSTLKELKDAGYILLISERENGKFSDYDYLVFETKTLADAYLSSSTNTSVRKPTKTVQSTEQEEVEPRVGKRLAVKPIAVKDPLLNNKGTKNNSTKKNTMCANTHEADSHTELSNQSERKYKTSKGQFLTGEKLSVFEQVWEAYGHKAEAAENNYSKSNKAAAAHSFLKNWSDIQQDVSLVIQQAEVEAHNRAVKSMADSNFKPKHLEGWLSERRWTQESVMIDEGIYLARGAQHDNSNSSHNKLTVAQRLQRLHEKRQREAND